MVGISEKEAMSRKGLVLLSGGLDSTLAAKVLLDQGLELEAINFFTCFCTCTKKGCKNEAKKVSEALGINLKMVNVTKEYLEVVKNPKHGYGSNMNPCIDCRIFMFKKAKDHMGRIGASFIVTGEVLGERPMSQRADAIRIIEKESGLNGLIVRPLSAKLFEPSLPEKEGVVDRNKLLSIQGRSRKPQMELAKSLEIADYPCPAGGCLLTDPGYAKRAKDLLFHEAFALEDIRFLRIGRHFRLGPRLKLLVGRNEGENKMLLEMAGEGDMLLDAKNLPGPIGLLRGEGANQGIIETSAGIISRYSDGGLQKSAIIYWKHPEGKISEIFVSPATEKRLGSMRI